MSKSESINKFMSGKKKVGASVFLPIIAVIVNSFVADPAAAKNIMELVGQYLPSLIVMVSGWFFTANEAAVDKERAKAETAKAQVQPAPPPAPPPVPPVKPKRINFKAFAGEVQERVDKDKDDRPTGISLYYAVISEGKQWEVEILDDVWEYAQLVTDAAKRKFEATNRFDIDDPDLAKILRTIGKCPYSSVEAFCAYEGNRTALLDVRDARRHKDAVWRLIETDATGYWRTAYDTTLYGIFELAPFLISQIEAQRQV